AVSHGGHRRLGADLGDGDGRLPRVHRRRKLSAPLLYLAFGILPGWPILLAPIGIAIVTVNGFWIVLLVGTLCARFRDLPQIIANLMQIAFFVTPVMWKADQLPREASWLVDLNPLASLLALIRHPPLGPVPRPAASVSAIR